MALQLRPFVNRFGYEVNEGYFELIEVSYNKRLKLLHFQGEIYLSKEAKDNGFYPIDIFDETCEEEEEPANMFQYAYDKIKHYVDTTPEEEIIENNFKYKGFIGYKEVD